MELTLDNIRSICEKILVDKHLGAVHPASGSPLTQQDVWKAGPALSSDDAVTFTLRNWRDAIAQVIFDALTDATSTGGSLTIPDTFGGGNRTEGTGNILLRAPATKQVDLAAGTFGLRVTPVSVEATYNSGVNWVSLFNIAEGIEWSPTKVYNTYSWVSYQGKLYLSRYAANLGKTPGTAYPPPGFPLNPPVQWWLLFTERIGEFFYLPNTVLTALPNGSVYNIHIAALAAIDASKISGGTVSNSEFDCLDGVSSSIQSQLNGKLASNGDGSSLTGLTKTQVGLGNVENTSDLDKPVSTATSTALGFKANDADVVHDTGNEIVAGVKTFTSFPITPSNAPSTNYQVTNKKYVDDTVAGAIVGVLPTTTVTSDPYTVLSNDRFLLVDASSGSITIDLMAAATAGDGKVLNIKKVDSSSNILIIDGNGTETIDGQLTVELVNPYNGIQIVCNGSSWFIVA